MEFLWIIMVYPIVSHCIPLYPIVLYLTNLNNTHFVTVDITGLGFPSDAGEGCADPDCAARVVRKPQYESLRIDHRKFPQRFSQWQMFSHEPGIATGPVLRMLILKISLLVGDTVLMLGCFLDTLRIGAGASHAFVGPCRGAQGVKG